MAWGGTHSRRKIPVHPTKDPDVKAEIDKLHKVCFIYPITYTTWVSNHVPINKKQGTICVYTEFYDLNLACPKDNFPTLFIDQIIDACAGHEVFSFMDGFFGYNQIHIWKYDKYKTAFTNPWGTIAYRVMLFGLKNAGATFQWAMMYYFHDLIHIILVYLNDLTARPRKRSQHLDELRQDFLRCHKYNVCLNPLKCVFCVPAERLLGFIVSHKGILIGPLKVQAILNLPSPHTLSQL